MFAPALFLTAALATTGVPQQPASTPPRPSSNAPDDRLATLAPPASVVVEGCVDRATAGQPSEVGEGTALRSHFVLTAAKVLDGTAPAVARVAGGAAAYDIDGLTDEQLTLHVGRRVRIDGTLGSIDRGATPADPKNAPRFDLTAKTIRQVPGDCSIPKS